MNTKTLALLFSASAVCAAAARANADEPNFERVFYSEYTDHLVDAERAYDAKRYDEAFKLFQRAACAGDKQSQSAIGRMYLLGQSVEHDDLTGYAWLKVAAEVQFPGYQSVVHKLEEVMNEEQRKIADQRAGELIGLYGLRPTNMSCKPRASRNGHIIDMIECSPRREGRLALLRTCVADVPH